MMRRPRPNQAMLLTESKLVVHALGVCHPRFSLRRDHTGLAAAMRAFFLLVGSAFALTSCIAGTGQRSFPSVYRQPGHDYHLSRTEIAEISRLVAQRPDILTPVDVIGMLAPDYAQVSSRNAQRDGDGTCWFHIRKKAGKWTIEEPKVTATKAVSLIESDVTSKA